MSTLGQSVTPFPPRQYEMSLLSVVVPTYNEEENVDRLYTRLKEALDKHEIPFELIFSVDPSTDATETKILKLRDHDTRVKMLLLSRRFGQPAATIAGMSAASGDACVVIDCDLQDPPELIVDMVAFWKDGYDVVYAQRRTRRGETLVKRVIAALGYKIIGRIADVDIPENTGDFRLLSRRSVNEVLRCKETHGFLRGLVAVIGFRQTSVLYERDKRAGGRGKYNRFFGSLLIGLNGIVSFSRYPLQVISLAGITLSFISFVLAATYVALKLGGIQFPTGNPTIVVLLCFFAGIQLLSLGIMGEYVGRIYDEVKGRPMFIVDESHGIEALQEVEGKAVRAGETFSVHS